MERGFRFIAEKVYAIPGRGIVVTGKVESGSVSVGSEVGFQGTDGKWTSALVVGIEVNRRLVEEAEAGQQASILLEGVRKDQVTLGTVLQEVPAAPGGPVTSPPPESAPRPVAAAPPSPYLEKAIHPPSSLWRTIFFIVIGILVILAILYFQGKWDPRKITTGAPPSEISDKKIEISLQQAAFSQAKIPIDL